jgi:hypothetical protein
MSRERKQTYTINKETVTLRYSTVQYTRRESQLHPTQLSSAQLGEDDDNDDDMWLRTDSELKEDETDRQSKLVMHRFEIMIPK